jgi:hypothetical protein
LSLLTTGGVHTPTELAGELGVSEGLLEQMLADLSRMGYLRLASSPTCPPLPNGHPVPKEHPVPNGHFAPCAQCPLSNTCAVAGPGPRVWALTDKARRQAEEVSHS